jgi:hypothetical protein
MVKPALGFTAVDEDYLREIERSRTDGGWLITQAIQTLSKNIAQTSGQWQN